MIIQIIWVSICLENRAPSSILPSTMPPPVTVWHYFRCLLAWTPHMTHPHCCPLCYILAWVKFVSGLFTCLFVNVFIHDRISHVPDWPQELLIFYTLYILHAGIPIMNSYECSVYAVLGSWICMWPLPRLSPSFPYHHTPHLSLVEELKSFRPAFLVCSDLYSHFPSHHAPGHYNVL